MCEPSGVPVRRPGWGAAAGRQSREEPVGAGAVARPPRARPKGRRRPPRVSGAPAGPGRRTVFSIGRDRNAARACASFARTCGSRIPGLRPDSGVCAGPFRCDGPVPEGDRRCPRSGDPCAGARAQPPAFRERPGHRTDSCRANRPVRRNPSPVRAFPFQGGFPNPSGIRSAVPGGAFPGPMVTDAIRWRPGPMR